MSRVVNVSLRALWLSLLAWSRSLSARRPTVKFLSRGHGYSLMLAPTDATVVLTHAAPATMTPGRRDSTKRLDPKSLIPKVETRAVRMSLLGANRAPKIEGVETLAGISNYFVGNDRSKWRSNIPNYAKVRYSSVYPGVDLVYYGTQGHLEYDFVVAPHANPNAIRFAIEGADNVAREANGDLAIDAGGDHLALRRPVVYQQIGNKRKEIAGRFKWREKKTIGFELASYDRSRPLMIDPGLVYSTYIGGFFAMGHGIAVDSSGSAYVVGFSALCGCLPASQVPYPTTAGAYNFGAPQSTFAIVVTKLSPDGSGLVYSTYFGGTNFDAGYGIALDPSNDAYVTGLTTSGDFPTVHTNVPSGSVRKGGVNAFVTELNPAGSGLVYSTYLGSSTTDEAQNIAVDGAGNAYVAGWTISSDFPTTPNAFQGTNPQTPPASNFAGFLSKLTVTSGNVGLAYSTYVADAADSTALPQDGSQLNGVAVDGAGNAYVTGWTGVNFPVTIGPVFAGKPVDAFVARFDTTLSGSASLIYARYLGGSSNEAGNAIGLLPACASNCSAYVGGITSSVDFASNEAPVIAGRAQPSFGGQEDGFLAEVDFRGALTYWTYLGGAAYDQVLGLGVDAAGQVYATGSTDFVDFPTTSTAFQPSLHSPVGQLFQTTTTDFLTLRDGTGWTNGALGLTSIALDPVSSPATMYVSSLREGIFKSTDGGATFSPTAFNMPGVTSIAINTNTHPHTLFWTTGSAGIFESTYRWTRNVQQPGQPTCGHRMLYHSRRRPRRPIESISWDSQHPLSQHRRRGDFHSGNRPADCPGQRDRIGRRRQPVCWYRPGIFESTNQGATFAATNENFSTIWSLAADTTNHIVLCGQIRRRGIEQ